MRRPADLIHDTNQEVRARAKVWIADAVYRGARSRVRGPVMFAVTHFNGCFRSDLDKAIEELIR